jgi:hypothetical protein
MFSLFQCSFLEKDSTFPRGKFDEKRFSKRKVHLYGCELLLLGRSQIYGASE